MHPVLFHIGSFPVGTYGLILAIAFFAGVALARRQGRMDGLAPAPISDLSIALLIAAVIGAKLLMIIVGLLTPAGQDGAMAFSDIFTMGTPKSPYAKPFSEAFKVDVADDLLPLLRPYGETVTFQIYNFDFAPVRLRPLPKEPTPAKD